jgi:hypothetical protein
MNGRLTLTLVALMVVGLGSHSLSAMGFPGYNAFAPESGKSLSIETIHG